MTNARMISVAVVMLLLLLSAGTYVCVSAFCGPSSAASPTARNDGPRGQWTLYVAEKLRDLGRTPVQKKWDVDFPIRNIGTRRLVVNELDPGCRCGNRVHRTILIPPGETAEVAVTLNTRFDSGPIETTAVFTTNDPGQPRFNLTVRAWVDAADVLAHSRAHDESEVSILILQ